MKAKKTAIQIIFGLAATLLFTAKIFAQNNTPVGYWNTVDDKTGQVLSVVQIYQAGSGLQGRIVAIKPVLGQKSTDICTKCKGQLQNRPMMGLGIIWGMQQVSANTWGRGRVLDPKSGNIYQGTMTVINNGNALRLRGYVGVPMFGRSETWIRTSRP